MTGKKRSRRRDKRRRRKKKQEQAKERKKMISKMRDKYKIDRRLYFELEKLYHGQN